MSLTDEISPKKFQLAVNRGFKRLENFRLARIHFLSAYAGPYYDKVEGQTGTAAINLIFNAVRVLVPTMVMNFPKHKIETPYLAVRQYAELLSLALDQHDMKIDIRNTYRRVIVDAIFTLGILKTGLAQSDSVYALDDLTRVDPGTVYTEAVDFDNFVVDPACRDHMFRDATFMGDRITVPRKMLLDSGLYNNDLITRLPRAGASGDSAEQHRAKSLSMDNIDESENAALEDDVEIAEIWVPSANAMVTVPGAKDVSFDDYLRVDDYYGVKEGPYTFLSLTPPMPGNPLPVPMVGIWHDLHVLANRMAKKIIEQAERQKDIVFYKRAGVDDAQQARDAGDGEAVACDDPESIVVKSFGGQQNSNETQLNNLEGWFNMMAGNPAQVGGQNIEAKSATAANLLQQNAGVGLEDMKDMVYQMAASEARKRAWYFHTDPLMQVPLVRRQQAQTPVQVPTGQWLMTPTMQDVQVVLTPEVRRGDFIDFVFQIEPESMGRIDSKVRLQQAQAFCQQIMPAVMAAAQIAAQLMIPFDAKSLLIRMAKEMGITWLDEVLYDPQFQAQMQQQMMMGPQAQNSKGQAQQQPNPGLGATLQNGQPGQVQGAPQGQPSMMQNAQSGANAGQQLLKAVDRGAFRPPNPITSDVSANAF